MPESIDQEPGRPGDLVVIAAHTLGGHELVAEIVEALGEGAHTHYRVRWEDDHESIFFLGPDATIRRAHAQCVS
ncbi:MAG TPA: DUF1918 domain-containing protein [Gaiellaceae bacterium]|nr:DUF1918 domain-containing protein [Gaiellaceae bacterium]